MPVGSEPFTFNSDVCYVTIQHEPDPANSPLNFQLFFSVLVQLFFSGKNMEEKLRHGGVQYGGITVL